MYTRSRCSINKLSAIHTWIKKKDTQNNTLLLWLKHTNNSFGYSRTFSFESPFSPMNAGQICSSYGFILAHPRPKRLEPESPQAQRILNR